MTVYDSAFQILTDDPAKVRQYEERSDLMNKIVDHIYRRRLTQGKVVEILGISQPRISRLMNGHIGDFSMGWLFMAEQKLRK